jgi:hypothetical protein
LQLLRKFGNGKNFQLSSFLDKMVKFGKTAKPVGRVKEKAWNWGVKGGNYMFNI